MSNDQLQADTKQHQRQQAALARMEALRDELLDVAGEYLAICEAEFFGHQSAIINILTTDDKPETVGCIVLYRSPSSQHFTGETALAPQGRVLATDEDAKNFVRALSNPHTQDLLLGRPFRNLE